MQLETVKEQQKLEFERLQNKLSKIDDRIDKFQSDLDGQIQKVEMGRQEIATVSKRIDDSLICSSEPRSFWPWHYSRFSDSGFCRLFFFC